jgi:hypothetical protein
MHRLFSYFWLMRIHPPMKKTLFLLLLLPLLLLSACNGTKSVDEFEISGTLADYPDGKVYLDRVIPSGFQVVDSASTDGKGQFTIRHAQEPGYLFTIRLSNHQSILLAPGKDKLTLTANAGQLDQGKVIGNGATESLLAFNKTRNALRSAYATESRALNSLNRGINPEAWRLQEAISDRAMNAYREFVRGFADTTSVPELAWFAANNLSYEGDLYYIQQFVANRKAAGERSDLLDHLETAIAEEGANYLQFEATDFISADVKGDSVTLSSRRGKVTYLFVWASYCGLSRMESARLAKWRHSHPDVPIEIMTFSIDADDADWRTALKEDSLDWPGQIRGLNEWSSPEIQQFEVDNVPCSYILDANGVIRSKNATVMDLERDYEKMISKWGR